MRFLTLITTASGLFAHVSNAQVKGKAFGFATDVTGGGSAAAATPSSLAELKTWLTDSTARTIVIDRTWDFTSSEGTTNGKCCTSSCSSGGQQTIADSCSSGSLVSCTYNTAARSPIDLGSNKSIVGKGSSGVIKGKGFRVRGGNSNVIIQNIHITGLNPQYVWGGDAITLDGADRVWIDHNKFSLTGRQFIVSGFGKAGRVTISNNEFDGKTSWSAACNGKHYWTILLAGLDDQYTISGNYFHDVSGRAPHIGTTTTASQQFYQFANNYFSAIAGHAFDIDKNTWSLIEGNYFDGVKEPFTSGSNTAGGTIYDVITVDQAGACSGSTGYICEWNKAYSGGSLLSKADSSVLSKAATYKQYLLDAYSVADVPATVKAQAGVGKV